MQKLLQMEKSLQIPLAKAGWSNNQAMYQDILLKKNESLEMPIDRLFVPDHSQMFCAMSNSHSTRGLSFCEGFTNVYRLHRSL